jgi:hypothetical protein
MNVRGLAFFLILFLPPIVWGQESQCSRKLSDIPNPPELFGFRLGMTKEQVRLRVPQVVFGKLDPFAVSKTTINPDFDSRIDKSTFVGVRTVSLDFLDGKLTSLWLGYDGSFKWQTIPAYVNGISRALNLPEAWTTWRGRGQKLRCADFHMIVSFVSEGPSFQIVDDNAAQTIAERRPQHEEESSELDAPQIIADRQARIYYPEGCQAVQEIEAKHRVAFKTSTEAEKAGYKPAKQCR